MANKLNTLSKNGVVTGSVAIVLLFVFIVLEAMELHRLVENRIEDKDSSKNVLKSCGMIVLYLLGILLCSFFISGIRRRRQWLMLPLLLLGLGGAVYLSVAKIYESFSISYNHMTLAAVITCISVVILYPICMLFCEIRQENIDEQKHLSQFKTQRA